MVGNPSFPVPEHEAALDAKGSCQKSGLHTDIREQQRAHAPRQMNHIHRRKTSRHSKERVRSDHFHYFLLSLWGVDMQWIDLLGKDPTEAMEELLHR